MDWLTAIKDIVVTASALTAAVVAVVGLNAWRRQLAGQNEYEVGQHVLRASYRVRDAITTVRHPFMSSGEQAAALAEQTSDTAPTGDAAEDHRRAMAAAYNARWRGIVDALQELDVARVEAEALWGPDAAECCAPLRKCIGRLRWALEERLSDRTGYPEELYREIQSTAFSTSDDPEKDAFSASVKDAIAQVEAFVRPKLK